MTFHHFVNCVALAFGPIVIFYKTIIKELDFQILQYLFIIFAYICSSLLKLLLEGFAPSNLYLKSIFLVALVALDYFTLSYLLSSRRYHFIDVGFGWSVVESLAIRLIPLWIGARSYEFNFLYLKIALEANLSLLQYISALALLNLLSKRREELPNANLTQLMLVLSFVLASIFSLEIVSSLLSDLHHLTFIVNFIWILIFAKYSKSLNDKMEKIR